MSTNNHIEKFGILLEDVLISREKALKSNKVEDIDDFTCTKSSNTHLVKFFAPNDDYCLEHLWGVDTIYIFCSKCMDIIEFKRFCLS